MNWATRWMLQMNWHCVKRSFLNCVQKEKPKKCNGGMTGTKDICWWNRKGKRLFQDLLSRQMRKQKLRISKTRLAKKKVIKRNWSLRRRFMNKKSINTSKKFQHCKMKSMNTMSKRKSSLIRQMNTANKFSN